MKKLFQFVGFLVCMGAVLSLLFYCGPFSKFIDDKEPIGKDAILLINLDGIILDGKKFLEDLKEYRERDEIKGILVHIDSPGGVVGPSQEMYAELKKVREELKKPVIVHSSGVLASGAYYTAVGADKIIVNPGTLMGSIGVIMEFVNLEGLYSWAKINRYVLKTGKFKDTGADYRSMTDDEKKYMQGVMDEVWGQFKTAVAQGRNLSPDFVNEYSDGRIFTGETGVKLGFADQVGTLSDAEKVIGELTGLGAKPEIFEVPKRRPSILQFLMEEDMYDEAVFKKVFSSEMLRMKLAGKLLFIMPGSWMN